MRLVLLTLTLCLTLALSAQERRGSVYLTGSTSVIFSDLSVGNPELAYIPFNPLERFDGIRGSAFRTGYFVTNRLLLGTRADYLRTTQDQLGGSTLQRLVLQPFVRYYFLNSALPGTSFFGELGFGTFGFWDTGRFETDFHLGVGAEQNLAPGILATANLNYDANASGLNFTNLTLGLNVLTGLLGPATADAPLSAGNLSVGGQLLRASYGYTNSGSNEQSSFRVDVTPRIGYFILDGLMLEGDLNLAIAKNRSNYPTATRYGDNHDFVDLEASLRARYYPLRRGRLLPYAGAGASYVRSDQSAWVNLSNFEAAFQSFPWEVSAGADYFISPQLAIEADVNYNRGRAGLVGDMDDFRGSSQRQVRVAAGLRFFLARR